MNVISSVSSLFDRSVEGLARIESLASSAVEYFWDSRASQYARLFAVSGSLAAVAGLRVDGHILASGEDRLKAWRVFSLLGAVWATRSIAEGYSRWRATGSIHALPVPPIEVVSKQLTSQFLDAVIITLDALAISSTALNLCRWDNENRLEGPTGNLATTIGMGWLIYRVFDIGQCYGEGAKELIRSNFTWLRSVRDSMAENQVNSLTLLEPALIDKLGKPWHHNIRLLQYVALVGPLTLTMGATFPLLERDVDLDALWLALCLTAGPMMTAFYYLFETRHCFLPLTSEIAKEILAKSVVSTVDGITSFAAMFAAFDMTIGGDEPLIGPIERSLSAAWLLYRLLEIGLHQGNSSTQLIRGNWTPALNVWQRVWNCLPEV